MPDNPRPFTIDADRRARGVQIALVVAGVPFVASLAGLALRSPLADLALLDRGPLAIVSGASGAVLLLVVAGAWAVDWWTVKRQLRALAGVNRQLEATGNELETERARHALELKIETMAIDDPAEAEPDADLDLRPAVPDARRAAEAAGTDIVTAGEEHPPGSSRAAEPPKPPERTS